MKDTVIDSVMEDIRNAEKSADERIERAKQEGKDLVLAAQAEAEKRKAQNRQSLKDLKRNIQLETERRALEKREALLKKGEAAAKELIDNKNSAVEDAAELVASMLTDSYLNVQK